MATASPARPRPSLDREVILDTAVGLASGGDALTVRALGAALGADPTAIYRHFRGKDELVRAVWDRLLLQSMSSTAPEAPWREQLRGLASECLRLCTEHPTIGRHAHAMTTGGPGELAAVEFALEQFQRAGLDPHAAVRFYAVYSNYLLAMAGSVAAAVAADPAGEADQVWIGDVGPVDPRRYPAVAAARDELAALRDSEVFMTGVDVILDAAEAHAQAHPQGG